MSEMPSSVFNPAFDLPATSGQLTQVRAVAVAESEWDTVGGPLVDQVMAREVTPMSAAVTLTERYGLKRGFWYAHVKDVIDDRGGMPQGVTSEHRP